MHGAFRYSSSGYAVVLVVETPFFCPVIFRTKLQLKKKKNTEKYSECAHSYC